MADLWGHKWNATALPTSHLHVMARMLPNIDIQRWPRLSRAQQEFIELMRALRRPTVCSSCLAFATHAIADFGVPILPLPMPISEQLIHLRAYRACTLLVIGFDNAFAFLLEEDALAD